jgi:hypothetical protein
VKSIFKDDVDCLVADLGANAATLRRLTTRTMIRNIMFYRSERGGEMEGSGNGENGIEVRF